MASQGSADTMCRTTARAERAESSARQSQPEDLMFRADGDVADVELHNPRPVMDANARSNNKHE